MSSYTQPHSTKKSPSCLPTTHPHSTKKSPSCLPAPHLYPTKKSPSQSVCTHPHSTKKSHHVFLHTTLPHKEIAIMSDSTTPYSTKIFIMSTYTPPLLHKEIPIMSSYTPPLLHKEIAIMSACIPPLLHKHPHHVSLHHTPTPQKSSSCLSTHTPLHT